MRRFFSLVFSVFFTFYPQRIVGNKPNLDGFQHMYRQSDAENFSSVCLMVHEKIGSQTDRHGDNISVFFPMKKALKLQLVILDK